MERWRDRGFVADSDDEDRLESQARSDQFPQDGVNGVENGDDDGERSDVWIDRDSKAEEKNIASNPGSPYDFSQKNSQKTATDLDDLETDPLQDDLENLQLNLDVDGRHVPVNTALIPSINPQSPLAAPSSPDELQFEEFRTLPPRTPDAKWTNVLADGDSNMANIDSTEVSSLSSALSSPQLPTLSPNASFLLGVGPSTPQEPLAEISDPNLVRLHEEVNPSDPSLENHTTRNGRTLRQRNAIQLHPYILENAMYRNLMKTRGVRPVRTLNETQPVQNESNDTENIEYQDENEPPSSSPSSFRFPPVSPAHRGQGNLQSRTHREREVLRESPTKTVNRQQYRSKTIKPLNKRQKVNHEGDLITPSRPIAYETGENQLSVDNTPLMIQLEEDNIFDIPLSPPPSGEPSLPSAKYPPSSFRFPPGFNPGTIETEVIERRASPVAPSVIEINSSPARKDYLNESEDLAESEKFSEEERSGSDSNAVRKFQKRIKGVLPASFAKLDLEQYQQQAKQKLERAKRKTSNRERRSGKGVAQRVSRKQGNRKSGSPSRNGSIFLSGDSESDDELVEVGSSRLGENGHSSVGQNLGDYDQYDDIPEDNRIDYMAPPVSRPLKKRRIDGSKRSKPLTGGRNRFRYPPEPGGTRTKQTRITDTVGHIRRTKPKSPRPVKLSVLDADDVFNKQTELQPDFLRIAARNVRSRRDKGRRSPSRKVFKLATRTDTQDVNESLNGWKSGKIRALSSSALRQSRLPKPHRSAQSIQGGQENPVDLGITRTVDDENRSDANSTNPGNTTRPSNRFKKSKHNWIVSRGYGVSSFRRDAFRPAQPADHEISYNRRAQNPSAFRKTLSSLNSVYRQSRSSRNLRLARFLDQDLETSANSVTETPLNPGQSRNDSTAQNGVIGRKRIVPKKRQPQRVDAGAIEYRQPAEFEAEKSDSLSGFRLELDDILVLSGLHPAYLPYSVDYDVRPLQIGTYYHESTFIGSGKFSKSLEVHSRDLDADHEAMTIRLNDTTYRWGRWNETVASELGRLFDCFETEASAATITKDSDANNSKPFPATLLSLSLFKSVIEYVTEKLSFIDPADRANFVSRCTPLISRLVDGLQRVRIDGVAELHKDRALSFTVQIYTFSLVFCNQVRQVAEHESMDPVRIPQIIDLMKALASRIFNFALTNIGINNIKQFLEDNNLLKKREAGIRDEYPFVDAYIIGKVILEQNSKLDGIVDTSLSKKRDLCSQYNVKYLESCWESLFIALPIQEIDQFGIAHIGSRFQASQDQWHVIKSLLSGVFEVYHANGTSKWASMNNYIRALFHRCFHLIKGWGWRHCKTILDYIFDFFAKNSLRNLENEEPHGSPLFLEEIDSSPTLCIEFRDTCFHIFLKIVASAFQYMRTTSTEKKIVNFVWRLLPNHGRTYPKEEPLRIEDLNALKNHHDLLCTLYYSVPMKCRPPLNIIRGLVHPPSSHREACSINIHAWSRLVRFTLQNDKGFLDLSGFAEWHYEFISEILRQRSHARAEIEAQHSATSAFSSQYIEDAIIKNERHAEFLISDALVCMKAAIKISENLDDGAALVEKLPLGKLLRLYNPQVKRLDAVVHQTLDIILELTNIDRREVASTKSESTNDLSTDPDEESQESGAWDGILEICDGQIGESNRGFSYLNQGVPSIIFQFMSTCIGNDPTPDESLCAKVIDCWLAVASIRVKYGDRRWASYFNRYDRESWSVLGSTNQTRLFTPYFVSKLILSDATAYGECQSSILTHWSSTLVERGLFLKYQHELTNALLNVDRYNPLLQNLPFTINQATGNYSISLPEFCQRRVLLISCVLSNMRKHSSIVDSGRPAAESNIISIYRDMIRSMMATMKQNSEEVDKAGGLVPGSYVNFVHQVVEFLQENAHEIVPVDPYFVDPASFPLPASDPTYVAARLRRYGQRLYMGGKAAKQLVMFIQSVSERAAIDGQQAYLVNQLYEAMSNAFESGDYQKPTLRCFLLQCIIPEYVKVSFVNPAAWIPVRPLVQSTTRVFSDLITSIDSTNSGGIQMVVDSVAICFKSIYDTLEFLLRRPQFVLDAPILLTLTSLLEVVISSLAFIDYVNRINDTASSLMCYVVFFRRFAFFATATIFEPDAAIIPAPIQIPNREVPERACVMALPEVFVEAQEFTMRELELWLQDCWSTHGGRYFVRRGSQSVEVSISPDSLSLDIAKTAFVQTVQLFFGSMDSLDTFCDE